MASHDPSCGCTVDVGRLTEKRLILPGACIAVSNRTVITGNRRDAVDVSELCPNTCYGLRRNS
jgi:hypothetical protein